MFRDGRWPTGPPDKELFSMSQLHRHTAVLGAAAAVFVGSGLLPLSTANAHSQDRQTTKARAGHVLLISVDGLHQSDLTSYVSAHPNSALASLVKRGTSYAHA